MTARDQPRARSARELQADTRRLATRLDKLELMDPAVSATLRDQADRPVSALLDTARALASHLSSRDDEGHFALVAEALELCEAWDQQRDRAHAHARELVMQSLVQLRSCKNQSDLVQDIGPASTRAFGVQRVFLAQVDTGTWSSWQDYDASDTRGTGHPTEKPQPVALSRLPVEAEVVRTGQATRLTGEIPRDELPSRLQELAAAGPVRLAAIPVAGRAAALLYLPEPQALSADELTDLDENLQTFTAGLGAILERELLYQRFRTQRVRIRSSLNSMERIMTSLDTGVDLVRLVGREHADTVSSVDAHLAGESPKWGAALTPRERDVMALIVLGHDNSDIADELVITSNTVKSHLRNIMRKLGAVNRTELISLHRVPGDVAKHLHTERFGPPGSVV